MTFARAPLASDLDRLDRLPSWVTACRAEAPEDLAFLSGAALDHLHFVVTHGSVPLALLRARLALGAAEACLVETGRPERSGALRDAVAFLAPGDSAGPAGDVYLSWARGVERPVSVAAMGRALPTLDAVEIGGMLDAGRGAPLVRVAMVLEAALDRPTFEPAAAVLLAEAALAQSLGWRHVVPVLALGLERGFSRKRGTDLQAACYRAVSKAAVDVSREAAGLARRADRLRAVLPKLRAKGAEEAVGLFLSRDALAPAALTSLRSGRAARRFCDRLVELGVVRELTGRETFRLYGV